MQITAAVTRAQRGAPDGTGRLGEPRDDEILVRMVSVGICGGDLAAVDQIIPRRCRACWDMKAPELFNVWAGGSPPWRPVIRWH